MYWEVKQKQNQGVPTAGQSYSLSVGIQYTDRRDCTMSNISFFFSLRGDLEL